VRIVAISDIHGYFSQVTKRLPEADTLIFAGDFSGAGYLHEAQEFASWLQEISYLYKYMIICGGNHDWSLLKQGVAARKYIEAVGAIYLENKEVVLDGIKFWGSPASREFCNWAFNYTEEQLEIIWNTIPDDVNVLITHSMPYGILDTVIGQEEREGEIKLVERIKQLKQLKLYIGGHLHQDGGRSLFKDGVTYINASVCDEYYKPIQGPVVVQMDDQTKEVILIEE